MSTASAKSSDQDYFVGFSKPCESADDNESVATSAPDWSITDTAPESVADQDAEATGTRVSRLQDEPVVRLPRAAQLPLVGPAAGLHPTRPAQRNLDCGGDYGAADFGSGDFGTGDFCAGELGAYAVVSAAALFLVRREDTSDRRDDRATGCFYFLRLRELAA